MAQANQTEQATPRRREKAREKGQVARSRDLIGAASGMAAAFVLFVMIPGFPFAWRAFLRDCLESAVSGNLRMDALPPFYNHSGLFAATAAALGMGWIVALSSALAQGGLVFAPTSLLPAASRISPAGETEAIVLDHRAPRADEVSLAGHSRCLCWFRLRVPRLAPAR